MPQDGQVASVYSRMEGSWRPLPTERNERPAGRPVRFPCPDGTEPPVRSRADRMTPSPARLPTTRADGRGPPHGTCVSNSTARAGSLPRSRFPSQALVTQRNHHPRDERSRTIAALHFGQASTRRTRSTRM